MNKEAHSSNTEFEDQNKVRQHTINGPPPEVSHKLQISERGNTGQRAKGTTTGMYPSCLENPNPQQVQHPSCAIHESSEKEIQKATEGNVETVIALNAKESICKPKRTEERIYTGSQPTPTAKRDKSLRKDPNSST